MWYHRRFYVYWFAAILNISNCSRISAWYPLDIRHRGPKDVESSERKTILVGAGLGPTISFGVLTIRYAREDAFWAVAHMKWSWKGKGLHRPQWPQASHRDAWGTCPHPLHMLHKRSTKPSFLNRTTLCWLLSPTSQHQHNTRRRDIARRHRQTANMGTGQADRV